MSHVYERKTLVVIQTSNKRNHTHTHTRKKWFSIELVNRRAAEVEGREGLRIIEEGGHTWPVNACSAKCELNARVRVDERKRRGRTGGRERRTTEDGREANGKDGDNFESAAVNDSNYYVQCQQTRGSAHVHSDDNERAKQRGRLF